jgi:hypothetical protein
MRIKYIILTGIITLLLGAIVLAGSGIILSKQTQDILITKYDNLYYEFYKCENDICSWKILTNIYDTGGKYVRNDTVSIVSVNINACSINRGDIFCARMKDEDIQLLGEQRIQNELDRLASKIDMSKTKPSLSGGEIILK